MKKFIFVLALLSLSACTPAQQQQKVTLLTAEEAQAKVVDFVNNNLMPPGNSVTVKEISEEGSLYKVVVNVSTGQEVTSYLSKDGKKFFPQVYDIEEIEKAKQEKNTQQGNTAQQATQVPKADKPKVELFVMGFCPYGVQAEKAMSSVVALFGDKADINIRYIASVSGDDINNVKSLHGVTEGIEDARQLCVAKNYDKTTLWKYVDKIDSDCYPIYRNGDDAYKECWEGAAKNAGINISKINSCIDSEGVGLIQTEDQAAKGYGVTGSPSLIINGVKANPARTPEGYKKAICDSFNNPPAECEKTLSQEGSAASGGCN